MDSTIIVALMSLCGTLVGSVTANRLTTYRLEQLEKKVDLHNHAVERLYKVEKKIEVYDEKFRVANHRLDDLEHDA